MFAVKLHAQRVELTLLDARTPTRRDTQERAVLDEHTPRQPIEVSAHRALKRTLEQRLGALADGAPGAPVVRVTVQVEHVRAWRGDDARQILAALALGVEADAVGRLRDGQGQAAHTLTGPPYDTTELDDLHLGTCLEAFDAALPPGTIEHLNASLQAAPSVPVHSGQT